MISETQEKVVKAISACAPHIVTAMDDLQIVFSDLGQADQPGLPTYLGWKAAYYRHGNAVHYLQTLEDSLPMKELEHDDGTETWFAVCRRRLDELAETMDKWQPGSSHLIGKALWLCEEAHSATLIILNVVGDGVLEKDKHQAHRYFKHQLFIESRVPDPWHEPDWFEHFSGQDKSTTSSVPSSPGTSSGEWLNSTSVSSADLIAEHAEFKSRNARL